MNDLDLLALQSATLFVLDGEGRIVRTNSPAAEPPPCMYLARCTAGSIVRLRHDVGETTAQAIEALALTEPPPRDPEGPPAHLECYLRLLGAEALVERAEHGLTWTFPERLHCEHPAPLILSGTPGGDGLVARFDREGMPPALAELGFVDTGEFWPPWCVALEAGEVASIAFVARLGPHAAETGVATVPAFRGRGFAAAATAGWAAHPALQARTLFYSTSRENISSQRVAQRLNLRFLAASLGIY